EKQVITGLPQAAVRESIERIRRAINNSGHPFHAHRLLIHLAPASVKKDGPALDLPIAIGLLRATGSIVEDRHRDYLIAGELALDGRLRPIRGGLAMAMLASELGKAGVVLPIENVREASVVEGIDVIGVGHLQQAVGFLNGQDLIEPFAGREESVDRPAEHVVDFADVKGQESVKRALTIACAGSHNVLLIGPPGTGKSMLSKRIPTILPPLTRAESLETTRIYSAIGLLDHGVSLLTERPVRTPHHSATAQALVGGGSVPRPGECSLAHHGVLFLDELPEFSRSVLEMLRQPMEDGVVTIARVHGSQRFPAEFMLVAAMNPSEDGHGADAKSTAKYMARLSGPLLDRIDIHVEVPAVPHDELAKRKPGTDSATMRDNVLGVRSIQADRQAGLPNARLSGRQLDELAPLDDTAALMLKQAMDDMGLSARAYDKVRRVARTIADVDGSKDVTADHIAEAVQYRLLDRRF
ncbi:MAG: YifB family Mg chelatase-like AAA ATPase, partial [Planctomycetota bacterium]